MYSFCFFVGLSTFNSSVFSATSSFARVESASSAVSSSCPRQTTALSKDVMPLASGLSSRAAIERMVLLMGLKVVPTVSKDGGNAMIWQAVLEIVAFEVGSDSGDNESASSPVSCSLAIIY